MDEDFSIDKLRITDTVTRQNKAAQTRRTAKTASKDTLIGCPVWWLRCVLPVVKSKQQLAVAIYLWRRRAVCGGGDTFNVPNSELATLGITRQIKYRALGLLAAASLIKLAKRPAKVTPTVTILAKKPNGPVAL